MSTSKAGLEVKNGIAVIKFDNPPVNSLGLELRQVIAEAIERANADPAVEAVVLIGSGAGFSGGADIREFGTPKAGTQPNLLTLISTMEDSAKPVIAAISGVCMGGGLELALGLPLSGGCRGRQNRAAGSEAGAVAGRRRHAAVATADRRRSRG